MSSAATHNTSVYPERVPATGSRSFWNAKVGSFVALLPLGVWTINHLWDNLAAFSGAAAWESSVTHYSHPAAHIFTLVIVFLPLVLHTIWGLQRLFSFRPNNLSYGNFGNFKYIIQRVSAVGVLGFLGAHIYLAMLKPRLLEGHAERFDDLAAHMAHHPPTTIVYILGVLGVAYHLANGIWSFAMNWGLVASRPALKRFDFVTITLFVIFTAMGWAAIYALYQAGQPFPTPAD
jgi:succinate dehydrogenase / fumarate reductase, cytochrome b subunit